MKNAKPAAETTAVEVRQPQSPMSEAQALISQAINKNVPVETMEKLLAMRRELKAEAAKEAFDNALSRFQAECPVIQKRKAVLERDGKKVRYMYAPLDDIVSQIKGLLSQHGLSYTIKTTQDEKMLTVICKATHLMGHSEETSVSVPIGTEQYMSDVQKFGARITFAKRYAFCNAFGILTGDEDNDAVEEAKPAALPEKKIDAKVIEKINKAKTQEELVAICKDIKATLPAEFQKSLVAEYTRRKNEISDAFAEEVEKGMQEAKIVGGSK